MNPQSPYELSNPDNSIRRLEGDVVGFASIPAAFAWTLARTRVGVDINSRTAIAVNTAILLLFHFIANFQFTFLFFHIGGESTMSFLCMALVYGPWAVYQRQQRLKDLRAGVKWHTYHRGETRLDFLSCPATFVYRYIEAATLLLIGLVVRKLGCGGLGLYVAFTAVCSAICECHAYSTTVDYQHGLLNTLLEAEVGGETVEHFSASPTAQTRDMRSTSPLPTGADSELAAVIARRKREAQQ